MCLLIAEIIMLIGGIYALVAGKVKLTRKISLEGTRARIAALFLIAPLPLSLLIGFFIGFLIGIGTLPPSVQAIASVIELLLVLGGLAGAFIYGLIAKPKDEVIPE
jgi:hypothetical protein